MAVRQKSDKKIKRADTGANVKKKKKTGKEIAVIVVSIIMVVTMLLPSFAQIFTSSSSSSSSTYPTSFDDAASIYQPQVEEYQAAVDKDASDTDALYNLGTAQYTWAMYAQNYASTDDEKTQATDLFKDAYDTFGSYLGYIGSLDSTEAKTAAIDQALCLYYEGSTADAESKLEEVANETNYALAWLNLGMMYESDSDTTKAMEAYKKAEEADPDDTTGAKSYAESRLSSLNAANAESTGGASGLSSALDGTSSN